LEKEVNTKQSHIQHLEQELEAKNENETKLMMNSSHDNEGHSDLVAMESIKRLEAENKRLKLSGGKEKIMELESKLEVANSLNLKYAKDLESLKKNFENSGNGNGNGNSNSLFTSNIKEEEFKSLQNKNKELIEEKAKLEGYLRTAKTLLTTERNKTNTTLSKQHEELIDTKEKKILELTKQLQESKESSEREIKLMSSALYELGLEVQRLKAPTPNVQNIQKTDSFLSKLRKQ